MSVTTIPTAGIADDAVTAAKAGFDPGKIGQVVSVESTASTNTTSSSFVAVSAMTLNIITRIKHL